MKCSKCGKEISSGNIYCSHCGTEVQIVPDYNVMEDELFLNVMQQKKKNMEDADDDENDDSSKDATIQLYQCFGVACACFLIMLLSGFGIKALVAQTISDPRSEDGYLSAMTALADKEHQSAIDCFQREIAVDSSDKNAYFWIAHVNEKDVEFEAQIDALEKILEIEPDNIYACKQLIETYVKISDFDRLLQLADSYEGKPLESLFSEYRVAVPEFEELSENIKPGDTLSIYAEEGLNIYYTTDGTSPIENGILYYTPIQLEEGDYHVLAAACNEKGYFSPIVKMDFSVDTFYELEMPKIYPASGEYLVPQRITIDVPAGCSAYYTWDGTTPTVNSQKYRGGLDMPEGNNVLSVILIDSYGNASSVERSNFIYMP
ncbi:MAG: chitobiase/beta-hexosaminidase C-terminal domain-containing protein [bacterium]|nr:chitobiase/beta-hexosaminidase C-terminal domain-containing protein [bacterium]